MGELLDEGWLAKRKFSDKMTDPDIDELYETAKNNGVIGGNYWEPAAAVISCCSVNMINGIKWQKR